MYDKVDNYDLLKQQHTNQQNRLQKNQRTSFVPPMTNITEKAGFGVLKDAKVVGFYTNDLKATQTAPMLPMESEEAVHAVNGIFIIRRWTGSEVMHQLSIEVPAIVGAYNAFMNTVHRMDQIRSSCHTRCHEKRVSITLFTLVLDLAIINARAIFQKLNLGKWGEQVKHKSLNVFTILTAQYRGRQDPRVSTLHQINR